MANARIYEQLQLYVSVTDKQGSKQIIQNYIIEIIEQHAKYI